MKRSSSDQLVISLDGTLYEAGKNSIKPLLGLKDVRGSKWFITDFNGAPSQIARVDAPKRYADQVLKRRLRESGEISDDTEILAHLKAKRGNFSTELLYTAVPGSEFAVVEDAASSSDEPLMLFPIASLLSANLKKYGKN